MTRIIRTPSANADYDFTGSTVYPEGILPYDLDPQDAGTYKYYRVSAPTGVITVSSPAAASWTQGSLGPWFQDTSTMGSSVSRITVEARLLVPSSRAGDSTNTLFRVGTSNFALNLNMEGTTNWFCNGGGAFNIGGTTRTATWSTTPSTILLSRDVFVTILVDVDASQNPPTLLYQVNGTTLATGTLSGANGFFDGGANNLTLLARQNGGGGTEVMQDVRFEFVDLNINGSNYVRIEGNAATVNALTTPFAKAGSNAT